MAFDPKKLPLDSLRKMLAGALVSTISEATQQAIAAAQAVGLKFNRDRVMRAILAMTPNYVTAWLDEVMATTEARIAEAVAAYESGTISEDDVIARVDLVFDASRAELISTSETTRLFSVLNETIYNASGVEQQRFDTVRDPFVCPECEEFDDQVYAVDDPDAPEIPVHPQCRCFWAPVAANIEIAA